MKKTALIILALGTSFGFGYFFKTMITRRPVNHIITKQPENNNKMKKVTGIGGIFFKCKDPDKIKEWYKTHLGFDTDQYGTHFEWQEAADPSKRGSTQWSPFSETEIYFDPSKKDFMINYRVENLVNLVEQLRKEGVTIVDKIETYEYGKFVHIMDIEGNKIELWEPNFDYGKDDKGQTK
jgi:predicted enzyme related to lactoylglutathione lyase